MTEQDLSQFDQDEYIDVRGILSNYIRQTLKRWYIPLLLVIVVTSGLLVLKKMSLNTWYSETVYYSVTKTSGVYMDATIAARLAAGIPSITATNDFRNELLNEVGVEEIPGDYSFSAYATASANLFTVTLTCDDDEYITDLMDAFIILYPSWANLTVGNCMLTVTDRSDLSGYAFSEWSKKKVIVFGFAGGAFAWLMIVTIILMLSRKVYGQNEMERILNAPCLGMVPEVHKKERRKSQKETLLISNEQIDEGYLQAMRALRTRIERVIHKNKGQVFLLTSTYPQEGKSLLTLNIAMALQQHGKRVVVVDADMRGSGIRRILKIDENQKGLSDFMFSEDNSIENIVISKGNITVVPAGTKKEDMASILNAEQMDYLLTVLKKQADIILIDTPPADYFGDALVLSEFTDGVFFLVRTDYAEVKDIRKCVDPFYQQRKVLGYILNRVKKPILPDEYGYGYKYSYGYRNYYYGSNYGYGDKKSRKRKHRNIDVSDL